MKVLLLSGNPYNPNLSFFYQFKELARFLRRSGITPTIGFINEDRNQEYLNVLHSYKYKNAPYLEQLPLEFLKEYRAVIALGYPVQFKKIIPEISLCPFFLWSQVSKPPRALEFDRIIPVPLTWTTKVFLITGGIRNVEAVVPHGVNTHLFKPDSSKRKKMREKLELDKQMVIGFVGNNNPRKRYDLLLKTFRYIRNKLPHAKLLIKTDKKIKQEGFNIPELIKQNGLEKSVLVFEGALRVDSMVEIYNTMDIYLHLTEWEGFGIPVIEAGACGITVITHPIQGPYEIIPYPHILHIKGKYEEENGTKIRFVSPDDAAKAVLSIINNPEKLSILSSNLREYIKKNYSFEIISGKWLDILKKYLC